MTMPLIAPIRDQSELRRVSRCLLHVRESDMENVAVGGQIATFTRGAVGSITDPAGASFTTGYTQPSWETGVWANGERVMLRRCGSLDRYHFPCLFRPRAMSFYHEFIQGTPTPTAGLSLWNITNDAANGARLVLDHDGSTGYRIRHHNGSTEQISALSTPPSVGDRVVHWGWLNANGSVQMAQSINEGAATISALTSANTFASAWAATPRIRLSAYGTSAGAASSHRVFKLVAGILSLAQLQRAF